MLIYIYIKIGNINNYIRREYVVTIIVSICEQVSSILNNIIYLPEFSTNTYNIKSTIFQFYKTRQKLQRNYFEATVMGQ